MVVKNVIVDMLPSIWPLLVFVSVVAITLRCMYLYREGSKFILHKELLDLVFILYIVCLYYILTYQDSNSGINLIPFKEIFRYSIGSYKFMKNVVGNILLFLPFGFFTAYYLNTKKISPVIWTAVIVSVTAEVMQYYLGRIFDIDDIILNVLGAFIGFLLYVALSAIKSKLPKFMRKDSFINFVVIVIIILIILFAMDINIFSYL